MYFKYIKYRNFNIMIFCTPCTPEHVLDCRARQRYDLYIRGRLSYEELTGAE